MIARLREHFHKAIVAAAGNPLNVMSGNKFQREVDMAALPGVLGLELVRYYNSEESLPASQRGILGRGWRLSYEAELVPQGVQQYTVTHTTTLKPWRVCFGQSHIVVTQKGIQTKRSAHALELPAGSIQRLNISIGDKLAIHS